MNILGPSVGYTDLLDNAISKKLTDEETQRRSGNSNRNPLRPSSAGSCGRKLAYALNEHRGNTYYEKPIMEPATYRLLDLGHAVEFHVLRHFQVLKVFEQRYKQQVLSFFELASNDAKLKRELVEGSCDFVLWSKKYKAIGDVKSKKDKFSAAYKTNWDEEIERFSGFSSLIALSETAFYADNLEDFIEELGDDYLTDNLYQLNLYANSQFIKERGVDHAFLYRYNKNDSRHMEIRFRPSMDAYNLVQAKFNAVSLAIENKDPQLVEKDFMLGSSRCAFCDYKKECWPDDDPLREFFSTLPHKRWPAGVSPGSDLASAFEVFEKQKEAEPALERSESVVVKLMQKEKLQRVKLPNGNVYELKALKSPRPHVELRRSKL